MSKTVCPYCFESSVSGNTCPRCGERLPYNMDMSIMFSIIGSTEAGKSHYIATLIEQLAVQGNRFGWARTAVNDETMNLYNERFRKPLYEAHEVVSKTQTANVREHRPLIYSLCADNRAWNVSLVFYDAAGERFNDEEEMAKATRYINASSGVIFLLDPLQLKTVRERWIDSGQGTEAELPTLPQAKASATSIFQRIVNTLRAKEQGGGKIEVPVAVVLSKIDAIRFLLTEESPVFAPSFHRRNRGFSISDFCRIDICLKSFLSDVDKSQVLLNQMKNFEHCGCFGVSALGQNPKSTNQKLRFSPRPLRVLDPILWLLWQNDLIQEVD